VISIYITFFIFFDKIWAKLGQFCSQHFFFTTSQISGLGISHDFLLIAIERKLCGFVGTCVSLADIQSHVMREIPKLKERGIFRACIHMLMKPPRRN